MIAKFGSRSKCGDENFIKKMLSIHFDTVQKMKFAAA